MLHQRALERTSCFLTQATGVVAKSPREVGRVCQSWCRSGSWVYPLCGLIRLGIIIFEAFAVFFQLALTRIRELLPGLGHLLKVLAM